MAETRLAGASNLVLQLFPVLFCARCCQGSLILDPIDIQYGSFTEDNSNSFLGP